MHGVRAGLPFGMPGIGDEMDGAMQQAPQLGRHFMLSVIFRLCRLMIVYFCYLEFYSFSFCSNFKIKGVGRLMVIYSSLLALNPSDILFRLQGDSLFCLQQQKSKQKNAAPLNQPVKSTGSLSHWSGCRCCGTRANSALRHPRRKPRQPDQCLRLK